MKARSGKKYLRAIDGRKLPVRSEHAALNVLLQSCGAIVMKKACVLAYDMLLSHGLTSGEDFKFVANIHDEIQVTCRPEIGSQVGKILVQGIRDAGKHFNFNCPLDAEYKIGDTWAETH